MSLSLLAGRTVAWPCTAAEAVAFLRYYNEIQQGNYKRFNKNVL